MATVGARICGRRDLGWAGRCGMGWVDVDGTYQVSWADAKVSAGQGPLRSIANRSAARSIWS